ncbi:hypothetical protein [Streptomyces goshikiensis]|uniref:hypothetical protein n=1 Tax=Streptomyces goshikiensis TaxID=1942 RepID=UPI003656FD6B
MNIDEQIEAARTWEHGDPGPRPYDPNSAELMRTAALLERMAALIKADPVASARVHAANDPTILMGAVQTSAGRERLRLAFAEDPGMVLWLNTSTVGREVLAQVEIVVDAPDAAVAAEAIRTAPTIQAAQWRRRWQEERIREHEENLRYFASPEHAAAGSKPTR